MTLEIAWFGIKIATGTEDLKSIIFKIVSLGTYYYLITNFRDLSLDFTESLVTIASKLGGDFSTEYFYNPDKVVSYAISDILQPLSSYLTDQAGGKLWDMRFDRAIIIGCAWIGVLLSFGYLAIQLTVAVIEFHFLIFASYIIVPFAVWKPTEFIGSKTFSAVVGAGINITIIALVSGICVNVFQNIVYIPTSDEFSLGAIVYVIILSLMMFYLALNSKSLTSSLLSGMPNLSAGGFLKTAAATAGAVFGAGKLASGAPQAIMNNRINHRQNSQNNKNEREATWKDIQQGANKAGKAVGTAMNGVSKVANKFKPNSSGSNNGSNPNSSAGNKSDNSPKVSNTSNNFKPKG
jgi:P-type conjugative transfer protein TrbL